MKKITLIVALLFIMQLSSAQDYCMNALPLTTEGQYVVGPINGPEIPSPVCTENGNNATAGEWYKYTPTQDYTVTITSDLPINTGKDTRVHIYTGTCGALSCYAGDDDGGSIGNGYLSIVVFNVTAGTSYYIAWDNNWNSSGFTFQLTEGDVIVPPPTPISYINQTISTVNNTYNICVVDMNGDHKDDIVGVSNSALKIHYQGTGGTFTIANFAIPGGTELPDWSMAAGDFNKDGYNDLLLGSYSGLSFWKSNSTGTAYTNFTPGQYIFCQRTNFIDINNDGNLDAFSCHDVDPNVYYLNDGAANWTYYQSGITAGAYSLGIHPNGGNYASIWTDLDNDGDSDMFISKCSGLPCELHRNDGNGVFTDISATAGINIVPDSWSSGVFDYDNDGDMDILIGSNGSFRSKLYRNNLDTSNTSEEAYTDMTTGSGWDMDTTMNRDYISYDFDNDGFVDVMGGGNKIMFNLGGNGTFAPISYSGMGIGAVGDLNNDGFLDILNGSTIRYAVPNGNNWIKVQLQGLQSNSNGIGARVEIYGAWGKQIRDIRSGEGFEFMSSLNAHFGIGTATAIDKVVIKWPSGIVDVINNPAANQPLFVLEGSSPLAVNQHSQSQIAVYPNPAKEVLNITNPEGSEVKTAQIFDLNGKLVLATEITDNKISVQQLATGTYVLLVEDTNGKKFTQKFLKN
jgi:hypothetical protein